MKNDFEAILSSLERQKIEHSDKIKQTHKKKREKSVQNREFLTARSQVEDTMKTMRSQHFEGRYV